MSYNFNQVPGSLAGEVLPDEIMENIASVKKVTNNAADCIADALQMFSYLPLQKIYLPTRLR